MKGPDRPQTMQTTTPPPASAAQAVATTPLRLAASGKCDSGRVGNSISASEDWSVTHSSEEAAADTPAAGQRGPAAQTHSAGGAGSMPAGSRAAPNLDTAARSSDARGNTTSTPRKAHSTAALPQSGRRSRPALHQRRPVAYLYQELRSVLQPQEAALFARVPVSG